MEVQGHTDNSGTAEHNKILSEQRAEAVRAWLVQHGVAADRLIARGYGQEKPLVPNVTGGNRARNRRVQFIIAEKEGAAPPPPQPSGKRTRYRASESGSPFSPGDQVSGSQTPAKPEKPAWRVWTARNFTRAPQSVRGARAFGRAAGPVSGPAESSLCVEK